MSAIKLCSLPLTRPKTLFRCIQPSHTIWSFTRLHNIITPKPLRFSRFYSTLTETGPAPDTTPNAPLTPVHPWPEWVSFVDWLKSRGYFPEEESSRETDTDTDLVYKDIKLLKEPCFNFARDRYDIFRSLPKDAIQNIVEVGCPKLLRKVVNSAKRLREYVWLDEKTVCEGCSLKGSCDRAYLKPNDTNVRTVDVMRILLFYVLDPMVISGAMRPSSIEVAESSARRLLTVLMDLSEAAKGPASNKFPDKEKDVSITTVSSTPVVRFDGEWICPKCNFMNYSRNTQCRTCDSDGPRTRENAPHQTKNGDWFCPHCKISNHATNRRCRQCHMDALKKRVKECAKPKQGDWHCPKCKFLNYARNTQCRKCNEDASDKREHGYVELELGDWKCPGCEFVNFAKRADCLQCATTRPLNTLKPGEWICPKCYYLNFRRNAACLKCDTACPERKRREKDY